MENGNDGRGKKDVIHIMKMTSYHVTGGKPLRAKHVFDVVSFVLYRNSPFGYSFAGSFRLIRYFKLRGRNQINFSGKSEL